MIDNDSVACFESPKAGALSNDLPRWLVPGDHARLVAFGTFPEVLMVDGANIGSADGRRLGA
jgi:hypothetical protein